MVSAPVTLVLPNLVSFLQFLTLSDFTSLFVVGYPANLNFASNFSGLHVLKFSLWSLKSSLW